MSTKKKKKDGPCVTKHWFTVILLRPEYISDNPYDTVDSIYEDSTLASNAAEAVALIRMQAWKADGVEDDEGHELNDYTLIGVYEGVQENLWRQADKHV